MNNHKVFKREPFFIGVNYFPRSSGLKMWEDWNPQEIAVDFSAMEQLGLHGFRFFLITSFFYKNKKINPTAIKRYAEFLRLLESTNLQAIPTLFVGHMSGQNWEIEDWQPEKFYSAPEILAEQKVFIRAILNESRNCQNIILWCLSNELPIYQPGKESNEVTEWLKKIIAFMRSIDNRPITIGDGVWSPEINSNNSGRLESARHFHLNKIAPLQDILGLHFYPRYNEFWLQAYLPSFKVEMAKFWKSQVFIEEFGNSATMASEQNQLKYYREVLWSGYINGAQGACSWCWSDFDLPDVRPYLHNTFEQRFGLRKKDGNFRQAHKALAEIRLLSEHLSSEGWRKSDLQSCWLIIPSNFYISYPFDWENGSFGYFDFYLNTYGLLKSAGLDPKIVHEPALEYQGNSWENKYSHAINWDTPPRVIWLPRLKRLTQPFWNQILNYVQQGGTVYASFANDHWIVDLDELLQIESNLRFGLPDFYRESQISAVSLKPWGIWEAGEKFNIQLGGNEKIRETAYWPVSNCKSEILIADQSNQPLLIRTRLGKGKIYFALFPFEVFDFYHSSETSRAFLVQLYASIGVEETIQPYFCLTPGIEMAHYQRNADSRLICFNHLWEKATFNLVKSDKTPIKYSAVDINPKEFIIVNNDFKNITVKSTK